MNSHPDGISQLTVQHSHDLLDEGRRRQLLKEYRGGKKSATGHSPAPVHSLTSRLSALATSIASLLPPRRRRRAITMLSPPAGPVAVHLRDAGDVTQEV
jgi:hypothetical protein